MNKFITTKKKKKIKREKEKNKTLGQNIVSIVIVYLHCMYKGCNTNKCKRNVKKHFRTKQIFI